MTTGSHRAQKGKVGGKATPGTRKIAGKRKAKPSLAKRIKRILCMLLGLALLAAAGVAAYIFLFPPVLVQAQTQVTFEEKRDTICKPFVDEGVTCNIEWTTSSSNYGALLRQVPSAGERSRDVKLIYSKGPVTIKVPILAGLTQKEAQLALWSKGLKLGEIKEENSSSPKGVIIASSVEPATEVGNGMAVDVTVSNGLVSIPDWTGETRELVETEAANAGIKVKFKEEIDDTQAPGLVLSQSATAQDVENSTTVTITLSKRSADKTVVIPEVLGKTQAEAISLLASKGFTKIKTEYRPVAKTKPERVAEITPGEGKKVGVTAELRLVIERPSS